MCTFTLNTGDCVIVVGGEASLNSVWDVNVTLEPNTAYYWGIFGGVFAAWSGLIIILVIILVVSHRFSRPLVFHATPPPVPPAPPVITEPYNPSPPAFDPPAYSTEADPIPFPASPPPGYDQKA